MHKNRKGQALIEFVIILPVLIMLIFGCIDFGRIIYVKNELSNLIPEVEKMHKNNKGYDEIQSLVEKNNTENMISITSDEEYVTYEVYRYLDLVTPGLGIVMDNPYKVNALVIKEI